MKITAASVSMVAALIVASASGSGAPKQAIGGMLALLGPSAVQTTNHARNANQSNCAKWRKFLSNFNLKPVGSTADQPPDGPNSAC